MTVDGVDLLDHHARWDQLAEPGQRIAGVGVGRIDGWWGHHAQVDAHLVGASAQRQDHEVAVGTGRRRSHCRHGLHRPQQKDEGLVDGDAEILDHRHVEPSTYRQRRHCDPHHPGVRRLGGHLQTYLVVRGPVSRVSSPGAGSSPPGAPAAMGHSRTVRRMPVARVVRPCRPRAPLVTMAPWNWTATVSRCSVGRSVSTSSAPRRSLGWRCASMPFRWWCP